MLVSLFTFVMSTTTVVLLVDLIRRFSAGVDRLKEIDRRREEQTRDTYLELKKFMDYVTVECSTARAASLELNDRLNSLVVFDEAIDKLKMINGLAKSDVLEARRSELRRVTELKSALERIMSMATTSRQEPAVNDILALEAVTNRIAGLVALLPD